MIRARRKLAWLLTALTIFGNILIFANLYRAIQMALPMHVLVFLELVVIGLVLSPWVVRLPSGASWRPGMPLMMMSMFTMPPEYAVWVPIPSLILITARAKSHWTKYFETIAHVGLGIYAGAITYRYLSVLLMSVFHTPLFAIPFSALFALTVHLFVNRFVSSVIVANRDKRSIGLQLRRVIHELHWGYINAYLLIGLVPMMQENIIPVAVIFVTVVETSVFLAVTHKTKIEELQASVGIDGLTGCENRNAWEAFLDDNVSSVMNGGIAVFDINDFKMVNDIYGHLVGDQVLREFATYMGRYLPTAARLFRLGGDEFVLVLFDVKRVDELAGIVQQAVDKLYEVWRDSEHKTTVSVGVAVSAFGSQSALELFRSADEHMYENKRNRRKRSVYSG